MGIPIERALNPSSIRLSFHNISLPLSRRNFGVEYPRGGIEEMRDRSGKFWANERRTQWRALMLRGPKVGELAGRSLTRGEKAKTTWSRAPAHLPCTPRARACSTRPRANCKWVTRTHVHSATDPSRMRSPRAAGCYEKQDNLDNNGRGAMGILACKARRGLMHRFIESERKMQVRVPSVGRRGQWCEHRFCNCRAKERECADTSIRAWTLSRALNTILLGRADLLTPCFSRICCFSSKI